MPAIVESWFPASNHSYGVFLEDDIEVSPLFYAWAKFAILKYRYSPRSEKEDNGERLFGVSLYQQKNIELRPEGRRPFDAHQLFTTFDLPPTQPYLSQIPCSWGAVYFPEVWKEFHSYLALRLSETSLPISESVVPAIRSNNWPRSWKKYFIELVYLRGYVMLYPNYGNFESFATNHLEMGEHIHVSEVDRKRKDQFEVPLMPLERSRALLEGLPESELPEWSNLPVVDLWGSVTGEKEIWERGAKRIMELDSCSGNIRVGRRVSFDAGELMCDLGSRGLEEMVRVEKLEMATNDVGGVGGGGEGRRKEENVVASQAVPAVAFVEDEGSGADGGKDGEVTVEDADADQEETEDDNDSWDEDQT